VCVCACVCSQKREGLSKKLAEDPQYLDTLDREIAQLREQLQQLELAATNGTA
jgi:CII-binding regulator of phage lambda lysogenization HflD